MGKSEGIGGIVGLGLRPIAAPPWLAETGPEDAEVAGRLNRLMTSLAQHDQFSGVVQVQRSDRTIYAAAFGEADKAGRIANTLETRFTSRSRIVRGKK